MASRLVERKNMVDHNKCDPEQSVLPKLSKKRIMTDDDDNFNRPVLPRHQDIKTQSHTEKESLPIHHNISASQQRQAGDFGKILVHHEAATTTKELEEIQQCRQQKLVSSRKPSIGAFSMKPPNFSRRVKVDSNRHEEPTPISREKNKHNQEPLHGQSSKISGTSHGIRSGSRCDEAKKSQLPGHIDDYIQNSNLESGVYFPCDHPLAVNADTYPSAKKNRSRNIVSVAAPGAMDIGPAAPDPMGDEEQEEKNEDLECDDKIDDGFYATSPNKERFFSSIVSVVKEKGKTSSTQKSVPKKKERSMFVEHIEGPHLPQEPPTFVMEGRRNENSSTEKEPTLDNIPIAAEVVPNERDVEAQMTKRLRKQIMNEAVKANVVTLDEFIGMASTRSKSRKFLCGCIVVIILGVVLPAAMVIMSNKNEDEEGTLLCTLCANETFPSVAFTGELMDGMSCIALNESQAKLDGASEACYQGQALAWLSCGCLTLPPAVEDTTCTMCSDGSKPLNLEERANTTCFEWNTFLGLVPDPSSSDCEYWKREVYARSNCSCPVDDVKIASVRRILTPISGDNVFNKKDSPQRKALYWLAVQDSATKIPVTADKEDSVRQRYVAALFYLSTGGPLTWAGQYNFLSDDSICSWNNGGTDGVLCDDNGDTVQKIMFRGGNNLHGEIVTELSALIDLRVLGLRYNALSGSIPSELGELTALQELYLEENKLQGTLPTSIFHIQSLRWLGLDMNDISGTLPSMIKESKSLEVLSCRSCSLTGSLPEAIGDLQALKQVNLNHNSLTDALPPSLFDIKSLVDLKLDDCGINGTIPPTIGQASGLEWFSCASCSLTGSIPESISELSFLKVLDLYNNSLNGFLPSFDRNTNLEQLNLEFNDLSGEIPDKIFVMSNMQVLNLGNNSIGGTLSTLMGQLTALEILNLGQSLLKSLSEKLHDELYPLMMEGGVSQFKNDLFGINYMNSTKAIGNETIGSSSSNKSEVLQPGNNQRGLGGANPLLLFVTNTPEMLKGTIPESVSNLTSLRIFNVRSNNFTGTLPSFRRSTNLEQLIVEFNDLSGPLSDEMKALTNLQILGLRNNSFDEQIPTSFGKLSKLKTFDGGQNSFTGPLPESLFTIPTLEDLWLDGCKINGTLPSLSLQKSASPFSLTCSHCSLSGTIPESVGHLTALNLQSNKLTGKLPIFARYTNLEALNLEYNALKGEIPSELGRLRKLSQLDLSDNSFSGMIPTEISNCQNLTGLDLSHNSISGIVPATIASSLSSLESLGLHGTNLSSNLTELFCAPDRDFIDFFSADCQSEVECSCCSLCCDQSGENCE